VATCTADWERGGWGERGKVCTDAGPVFLAVPADGDAITPIQPAFTDGPQGGVRARVAKTKAAGRRIGVIS
jgi:hypothetical protein